MCSIMGWGKGCIRFWGRLDQNSGFHGNRKPPLTYNGENGVFTFSWLFLIRFFFMLADNEDMHKVSDKFEFWPDQSTDYGVSCPWGLNIFPIDLWWENGVSMLAHSFLIESSSKMLVTRTGIKAWTSSILGLWFPWSIYMFFKWDLTLAHWTQVSDRCPLGYLFQCHVSTLFKFLLHSCLIFISALIFEVSLIILLSFLQTLLPLNLL